MSNWNSSLINLSGNVTGTLGITNGGTGATTASAARTNLGLAIGTNVQAWSTELDAFAALASTAGYLVKTGAAGYAVRTLTQTANQVLISNPTGAAGNSVFSLPQSIATTSAVQFGKMTLQGTTTPQLTVAYDGSHQWTTSISSAGDMTLTSTSIGNLFNINRNIVIGNGWGLSIGTGVVAVYSLDIQANVFQARIAYDGSNNTVFNARNNGGLDLVGTGTDPSFSVSNRFGIGASPPLAEFHIGTSIYTSASYWGLSGIGLRYDQTIYTDNTSSGAVPGGIAIHAFAQPYIETALAVTYDSGATVYIAGDILSGNPPTCVITNPYALWAAGSGRFDTNLKVANYLFVGGTGVPGNTNVGYANVTGINATGDSSFGTTSLPGARVFIVKITEQLRVGYDTSNYMSYTMGATGIYTAAITGSGTLKYNITPDTGVAGYLRVGSATAPNNTTAGDLSCIRLIIGNTNLSTATDRVVDIAGNMPGSTSSEVFFNVSAIANPTASGTSSVDYRPLYMTLRFNSVGTNFTAGTANTSAGYFENRVSNAAQITWASGIRAYGFNADSSLATLTGVTTAVAIYCKGATNSSSPPSATPTITTAIGVRIDSSTAAPGTTITSQAGLMIGAMATSTNWSSLVIGQATVTAGKFAIYSASTDSSLFAGAILTTASLGYSTGSGGTVTQATNKSTGATLSKINGQITMNNAALAASTTVSFTLTNTTIAATDIIVINHISGGTVGSYTVDAQAAAGSALIVVRNVSLGSLGEAIVLAFAVIKSVTS